MSTGGETRFVMWDPHVHILPARRTAGLVRWIKKIYPDHTSREEMTADDVLADLHECGSEVVFNLVFPLREEETAELNDFNRELAGRYPEVVPFGSMHILTPRKGEVAARCIEEYGFAGIKLHPHVQGFEAFCPEFEPLYAKLDELGRPLLVHTGFDVFYRRGTDMAYMEGVLQRYPGMPLVLVHSLFPRFAEARRLMAGYPQLYLDMTNAVSAVRYHREMDDPGLESEELAVNLPDFEWLLSEMSDRIMFGTDHPAGMGSPAQIYDDLDALGLPREARENLLGDTARRLLG